MAVFDLSALDAFKVMVRDQIANSFASIAYYSATVKAQVNAGMAWCAAQISAYAQMVRTWIANAIANLGNGFAYIKAGLSYVLSNFRAIVANAFSTAINWVVKGFQYGYRFCAFILNNLGEMFKAIPRFVKGVWRFGVQAYHLGVHLMSNLAHFIIDKIEYMLSNIPLMLSKLFQAIKDIGTFIGRTLRDFVTHFAQNIQKLLNFGLEVIKAIGTVFKNILKGFVPFLKDLWHVVSAIGRFIANHAWEAFSWVAKGVSKRLFMGIGMVYGISAVIVETLGQSISALALKAFGLNLAGIAALTTLQTGLSIALAAFIGFQLVRFSVFAIGGVFALSFLPKQPVPAVGVGAGRTVDDVDARYDLGSQREYAPGFRQNRTPAGEGAAQVVAPQIPREKRVYSAGL